MSDRDQLERLTSCDGPAFRELYQIYAGSIAAREQKPETWICAMIRAPEYRFWISQREGHVTGFSILFLPNSEPFALLEYMAVAPERRNHGLGSEVFTHSVTQAVRPDGRPLPVLLEVDSDREASSDRQIRTRRQHFYRRLGCLRVAGLHYILPLAGEGEPPEMDLMVYAPERRPLSKADLERWLKTIYRDVYHTAPDDPRIARMLRGVSDPVRLD